MSSLREEVAKQRIEGPSAAGFLQWNQAIDRCLKLIANHAPDEAELAAALNLGWLRSGDARGHAMPPDLFRHVLAALKENAQP